MDILLATFVAVFGRAIQQLNVVGGHYLAAALTPYLIAAGDVAVILLAVNLGWPAIPWAGTGGAFGAVLAMVLHRRFAAWRRRTA
ncbi:MAG: hypothetical protein EOM21_20035 [Gammaproteobacteria bacterium]|nr:hypothetical protein [Gammaproteobacteria bacterium]